MLYCPDTQIGDIRDPTSLCAEYVIPIIACVTESFLGIPYTYPRDCCSACLS